jgi:hypothetical protein
VDLLDSSLLLGRAGSCGVSAVGDSTAAAGGGERGVRQPAAVVGAGLLHLGLVLLMYSSRLLKAYNKVNVKDTAILVKVNSRSSRSIHKNNYVRCRSFSCSSYCHFILSSILFLV